MTWSSDGRWLVADSGGKLVIWDREKKERDRVLDLGLPTSVYTYISPNRRYILSACRELTLIDVEEKKIIGRLAQMTVRGAFSPDSRRIYTGGSSGNLVAWSTETGKELNQADVSENPLRWIAVHPSGRLIAACDAGTGLYLIDASSLKRIRKIDLGESAHHVGFTRDRKHVVAFTDNGSVKVFGAR